MASLGGKLFRNPTNRTSFLAFLLVVIASYALMFSVGRYRPREIVILSLLGVAYTLIGTWVWDRLDASSHLQIAGYFTVQLGLCLMVLFLGKGNGWLLPMPLVSHAIAILERPWSWFVIVLVWLVEIVPIAWLTGLENLVNFVLSLTAAVVFVAIFSQLTVDEQKTREQAQSLADELAQANLKLAEFSIQAQDLAVAEERNRLAREIHDGVGHYLTAVNIQIKAAQAMLAVDAAQVEAALGKAQSLTQEALADIRRSVAALRTAPTEKRSLPEAIAALLPEAQAAGLLVDYQVSGAERPISPPAELTLYRAAQEGLTNVRKHAGANRVRLTLEYAPNERVRLQVQDDGRGLPASEPGEPLEVHQQDGFGLMGLRERVLLVGGWLELRPDPQGGTILELEVPG